MRSASSGAPVNACSAIAKSRAPSSNASCCTARSPASRAYLTARSTGPTGRLAQQCLASSASRGPRSRSRKHLERASGLVVEAASPQRGDLLVQRLGHDGMAEAQMARAAGAVDDDRDRRRFVERRGDIDVVPRESVQHVEREVAAEHRRRARSTCWHGSESWPRRRSTVWRTSRGICRRSDSIASSRPPSAASRRATSPAYSGLPSVSSRTRATNRGEGSAPVAAPIT